jgi:hypothetical protein
MVSKLEDEERRLLIVSLSSGRGSSERGVVYVVTSGKAIVARE